MLRARTTCSWITLACLALGALACDRDAKTPETKAAEAAPEAKGGSACDAAHGKAVEQELSSQCTMMPLVVELDVPAAPWKPTPSAAPADALPLDLGPEGLRLDGWGDPISASALPVRFAAAREQAMSMAAANGRPRSEAWVLAIASATPRADVAAVLQVLADAGLRQGHLRLAADPTEPLPQPRDPKLLAELGARLAKTDPGGKAMLFAQELQQATPPCPAIREVFSRMATVAPDDRCTTLARDLSKALVGCGCAKETEIVTLLYAVSLGVESPPRLGAAVPVTLDPAAAPRPGGTWAEVVAGLDPAALTKLWVSAS